jgi:predicted Zn-dependent protease
MLIAKIDPQAFSNIMNRITESMEGISDEKSEEDKGSILDYLSTHPSTSKRVEQAKRYSKCFQAGMVICDTAIVNSEL